MALIFFFFKQHLSRYPKPGDFFGFGGFCLFVCLFGWVFFSAKGLPWLCGQSSKWWIIIRGLLLEKQESSLGGGEVLGGGGEGWGKGRGGGGRYPCLARKRASSYVCVQMSWSPQPAGGGQAARYKRGRGPRVRVPPPARVCREEL